MKSLHLVICSLIVFGKMMPPIEARQSMRNIFDIHLPERRPRLIHSFIPPLNGNKYYQESSLRHLNERDPVKLTTWSDVGSSSPIPIIHNIFNDLPKTTPHYDAIVVKSVPEGTTPKLDNIKILSRFNDDDETEDVVIDKVTFKPLDSGDHTRSYVNDGEVKTTEKSTTDVLIGAITKKHFYFQVQPVRPEGESDITNETVYYID